jgi:hypothetical protein
MTDHDTEVVVLIGNELDGDAKAAYGRVSCKMRRFTGCEVSTGCPAGWTEEAEVAALTPNLSPT